VKKGKLVFIFLFCMYVTWAWHQFPFQLSFLNSFTGLAEGINETPTPPAGSGANVIKALPCFKCHIYERFIQEPAPGVFSHALHVQFKYHCNQCHSFRGHRQMVINTEICSHCHEAVPELKER
jgi:hypothetical protein